MINPQQTTTILWNNLFQLREKDELIGMVHHQLTSDFQRAGCPVVFDETLDPRVWSEALFELLRHQPDHVVQQLFYIIDLPETLIRTIQPADNYLHQLADAIIYRELVKVYYKITYSA
jgi:hypothetical protein